MDSQAAAHKDSQVSYGLTLVAGMPFSAELTRQVLGLQNEIERQWAGIFTWYNPEHLHITLAAPLRGRYRPSPPLQRSELPADAGAFFSALGELFASLPPLSFTLTRPHVISDGHCILSADCPVPIRAALAELFEPFAELDPVNPRIGLHMTLGYCLQDLPHALKGVEFDAAFKTSETVRHAWLVHYANRTLNQVVGRVSLEPGTRWSLALEDILLALGIV